MDEIEVAVTIIANGDKILLVWNGNWGAFTLPMTKLHRRMLGMVDNVLRVERWSDAAMRNVGECLAQTMADEPKLLLDVGELLQSDRTGSVNHYHFQVYLVHVESERIAPCLTAEWLTVDEIRDASRRPISPTARELTKLLDGEAITRGLPFPPPATVAPRRQSRAAVAITSREERGRKLWLVQWNEHWGRYYLVGGHREDQEAGTECLARELREELDVGPTDYQAEPIGADPLKYTDWSVSAWQDSDYAVWPFRVRFLADTTVARISKQPGNRWVSAEEIDSERSKDGRPISPTTRKTLQRVGEI